jgi:ATP-binding cassette subfamily B protein
VPLTLQSGEPAPLEGLRLGRRILPFWRPVSGMVLCMVVETLYWVATPLLLAHLIDAGLLGRDLTVLYQVLVALAVVTLAGLLAGICFEWLSANVLSELLRRLRDDMFEHLQRLSLSFYSTTSEAEIVTRFSSDAGTVEEVTASFMPWVVMPGLVVVGSTVALFLMDWRLALLSMLVWPASLIGPRISARRALEATAERRASEGEVVTQLQENVAAQPVVKAFVLREHVVDRFSGLNSMLAGLTARQYFTSSLVDRSSKLGVAVLQLVVLAWSAILAYDGVLTIGQLTAFQALFLLLGSNVDYIMQFAPRLIRSTGGLARIDALLRTHPDVVDRPDASPTVTFDQDIAFDDVTFAYDGAPPSLEHVTLSIPKNTSVALVGPSGSGKSTVLALLLRLYDPQEGAVRVDGVDIRTVRQDAYGRLLAPVLQDSFLFNTTVRENIRVGELTASDEEVEAAARAAEMDDAIRLMPAGYDTEVGFRGGRLSGGQRQRLAIARAILRDPPVLVLDEATSALDSATDAAINETLVKIAKDRTVVTVTHRLASVSHYDTIVVLAKGRVVEQGTHAELLGRGGVYTGLWNKQSGFQITDDGDRAEVTADRLRDIPVFSGMDGALLDGLALGFTTEHVPAGRVVVQQGDPSDRFFVIARGRVTASRRTDEGEDLEATVLEDGDWFGELGLLRNVPRAATVTAVGDCVFLTLTRDRFLRLLEHAPELRDRLSRQYPG